MKNVIKLIVFLIYVISVFFLQDIRLIVLAILVNILCMLLFKINIKNAIKNLWSFMGFIIFTGIINVIVVDIYYGLEIAVKLMIVCNITYVFSMEMTYSQMAETIENILKPLQIFKINTTDIGIMICISLAFIPILKDEMNNIKIALKAKGFKTNPVNLIINSKLILLPILSSILNRVNQIEHSLNAKGYID